MSFKLQITLLDEQQAHLKFEVPAHLKWEVSMKGGSKVPVKALKEPVGVPTKCHIQTRGDSRGSPGQGGAESSSRGSCETHTVDGSSWGELRAKHSREQFTRELCNIQSQEQFMGELRTKETQAASCE